MFGFILVVLLPVLLVPIVFSLKDENGTKLLRVLFLAYVARIFWGAFLSDLPVFSYGAGGDALTYQAYAEIISKIWDRTGVHYVTSNEFVLLGRTSLPPNLFALVVFLSGPQSGRIGAIGIIALCACLTALNLYRMAIELGADQRAAFRVMSLLLFMPAFFLYTSDIYKDGLVLFFITTAFCSALRLSRRASLLHAVIGALACLGLYGCRFYLIFVAVTPLFVSFIGIGSRNTARKVFGTMALGVLFLLAFAFTGILQGAQDEAASAYDAGTYGNRANARGGSGVTFDDGGEPTGAMHLKLLYTLFSPFPWTTGSIALHLGKIEAIIWYYFCYRAIIACRRLIKTDPGLVAMFVTFLVPTTFMYALIMSNIGLIVRERMGVVVVGMLLGTLSWAKPKFEADQLREELVRRDGDKRLVRATASPRPQVS